MPATAISDTPAARPIASAANTNIASAGVLMLLRKRTAATTPARLKASAMLCCTITTTEVTVMGNRKMVSLMDLDCSVGWERLNVQASGTVKMKVVCKDI